MENMVRKSKLLESKLQPEHDNFFRAQEAWYMNKLNYQENCERNIPPAVKHGKAFFGLLLRNQLEEDQKPPHCSFGLQ